MQVGSQLRRKVDQSPVRKIVRERPCVTHHRHSPKPLLWGRGGTVLIEEKAQRLRLVVKERLESFFLQKQTSRMAGETVSWHAQATANVGGGRCTSLWLGALDKRYSLICRTAVKSCVDDHRG